MDNTRSLTAKSADDEPFWRGVLDAAIDSMRWACGGVLLSLVFFGILQISESKDVLPWSLFLLTAFAIAMSWRIIQVRRRPSDEGQLSADELKEMVRLLDGLEVRELGQPLTSELLKVRALLKQGR